MSTLHAVTYDYPVAVTKSDTVNDPAGPFAGLLCTAAGTAIVWPLNGPQSASPVSIVVIAGQYLHFPVKRVGASSSNVVGLVGGAIVTPGPIR
jgi:hypothetical protein